MRTVSPPAVLIFWVVLSVACASFHPPISGPADRPEESLRIQPLRADPDGLHLEILNRHVEDGDVVEIWRRVDGPNWERRQEIAVQGDLVEALQTGAVQWIDPLDRQAMDLEYRLRHLRDGQQWLSKSVTIAWRGWPDVPDADAHAPDNGTAVVVLTWNGDPPLGVQILRRDVLSDSPFAPLATVDAAADGQFHDTDVEPGGVYAYRLRHVDRLHPFVRFSDYSSEFYVAVPE